MCIISTICAAGIAIHAGALYSDMQPKCTLRYLPLRISATRYTASEATSTATASSTAHSHDTLSVSCQNFTAEAINATPDTMSAVSLPKSFFLCILVMINASEPSATTALADTINQRPEAKPTTSIMPIADPMHASSSSPL